AARGQHALSGVHTLWSGEAPPGFACFLGAFGGKSGRSFLHCLSPLLPNRGLWLLRRTCPVSGVKRTCRCAPRMSAFDPKRTSIFAAEFLIAFNGRTFCPALGYVSSLSNAVTLYRDHQFCH